MLPRHDGGIRAGLAFVVEHISSGEDLHYGEADMAGERFQLRAQIMQRIGTFGRRLLGRSRENSEEKARR